MRWFGWVLAFVVSAACSERSDCSNGTCVCAAGHRCEFECAAPPCHVDCGPRTDCTGTCANGECTCAAGSTCAFDCGAGPCHVRCEGDHPRCDGECANGTCECGD